MHLEWWHCFLHFPFRNGVELAKRFPLLVSHIFIFTASAKQWLLYQRLFLSLCFAVYTNMHLTLEKY